MGYGMQPPQIDPEVARLTAELKRFREENAKLVRQLNAERQHVAHLENEVGRLDRENIQLKMPDARASLAGMLDDLCE